MRPHKRSAPLLSFTPPPSVAMRSLTRGLSLVLFSSLLGIAGCGDGGGDPSDSDVRPDRPDGGITPIDVPDTGGLDTITPGDATDAAADADPSDADALADAPLDGSGDADAEVDAPAVTSFIDAAGGRIEFDRVLLNFPRNALTEETLIQISFGSLEIPEGIEPLTPVYQFAPEGETFAAAVGMTVRLDARDDDARIFWTALDSTDFEPLRTDVIDERVTGVITHFSYGFVGRYAADTCGGDPVNACGGCTPLVGELGDACGNGGTLVCSEDATALECAGEAVCGDGRIGGDEDCDGDAFGGLTCTDFAAYEGGTLGCLPSCRFDFNACEGPDPCEGVDCGRAPGGFCDANIAVTYAAPGTCVLGVCEFEEQRVACDDLVCSAGACVNAPQVGDLVITEYLADPAGPDAGFEWFEIWNATDRTIDLSGITVRDNGTDTFVVSAGVSIDAGAYFVFAEAESSVPGRVGFAWNAVAPNFALANSDDEIILEFDGAIIDRVLYGAGFPRTQGASANLDDGFQTAALNETAEAWCRGAGDYGVDPNEGTPGAPNIDCNPPDPCEGVVCEDPPAATCLDANTVATYASVGACSGGLCSYDEATADCTNLGGCVDGACVITPLTPGAGDLVITEIMADLVGSDVGLEWIELRNVSGVFLTLEGVELSDDGADRVTIDAPLVLEDGATVVLGASDAAVSGQVAWTWGTRFTLGNTADTVLLTAAGIEVDRVDYDVAAGWPLVGGASMALDTAELAGDNNLAGAWCEGAGTYGVGENLGTPGTTNPLCPIDLCEGIVCEEVPAPTCEGAIARTFSGPGACSEGVCGYPSTSVDCTAFGGCVDGACAAAPAPAGPGSLVLTEFLANPAGIDSAFEWFELRVVAEEAVDLGGVTITDEGSDTIVLPSPLYVAAGARVVFAASATATPGRDAILWDALGGFTLGNSGDRIVVRSAADAEIERVVWDATWPIREAYATSIERSAIDGDRNDPANWCFSRGEYGVPPNQGTPGEANVDCALVICGDGLVQGDEECDDGNTETEDGCDDSCRLEPDPCAGVTCDAPPAAFCDRNTAVRFLNPGTCAGGTCSYQRIDLPCGPGGTCVDGACESTDPVPVGPGDLVITEFLADLDGGLGEPAGEWIEVVNVSGQRLQLNGMVIADAGSDAETITESLEMPPESIFVFAASAAAVPGGVDYVYGTGYALANSADEIILRTSEGATIDRVDYTGSWTTAGVSIALSGDALASDNADLANWCDGVGTYGVASNLGTPGVANPVCD